MDTAQLLNQLSKATDIQTFIDAHEKDFLTLSGTEYLCGFAKCKNISTAEIARRSGHGDYVYKVFNGERRPSRDVLIGISVGMSLSIDEAQLLLRIYKFAKLDPRDKRDSIIIFGLKEQMRFEQLNDLLYEMQEQTL